MQQRTSWPCTFTRRLGGEGGSCMLAHFAAWQAIDLPHQAVLLPAPFHPGAVRHPAAIGRSSSKRGGRRSRSSPAAVTAAAAAPVDIAIEPGPANSRCIWAGVDIAAPAGAATVQCTGAGRVCPGPAAGGWVTHTTPPASQQLVSTNLSLHPRHTEAVYAALTSYEALGTFIPGLAENRCLERHEDGCTLLQVWPSLACTAVHWAGVFLCS